MPSARNIIIQSVLKPATVYVAYEDTEELKTYTTYDELFAILALVGIDKNTEILVNRGPGSYTGIRTALTYVLGLIHGGLISEAQVVPYTSFDLIAAVTEKSYPFYLKSWPRLANGLLQGSKGYFLKGKEVAFVSFETIENQPSLVIYTEEDKLSEQLPSGAIHLSSGTVATETALKKLLTATIETQPLDPLYINPVNVTIK